MSRTAGNLKTPYLRTHQLAEISSLMTINLPLPNEAYLKQTIC